MKSNLTLILLALLTAASLLMTGCSSTEGEKEQVKPAVAVETAPVVLSDIQESIEVVGTLSPKFEANVKAEYPGIVAEVYVSEWVPVKKGTPLAKLDTRELEAAFKGAHAATVQAEAATARADREYERALKLKEAGLVTQQSLDDARSSREAAVAALDAARAQEKATETRLDKAVIRAPMDGTVAMRAVSPGDLASGDPIFRVVDTRLLNLIVTVPSNKIHEVKVGQELAFTTEAVPGRNFTGSVSFINPSVEAASRTVKVVAEVPNQSGELKAGLFVKGRILISTRNGIVMVPRSALLSWDITKREANLFAVQGDTAHRRTIQTGDVSGELVEVRAGLAPGEQVVTRGAFNLRDGDRVVSGTGKGA